jgi:NADH dehydrogenase
MRVAVAGGSGFIGRHAVAALRARGHDVVVLARGTRAAVPGARAVAWDAARDPVPVADLAGVRAIVNLVGIKRADGAQTFEALHVEATGRLLEAAGALGARLVQVSVVASRPDPHQPYHDTKWRAEERVRASGQPVVVLRPGVVYGPGDDMVTHLAKMIRFAPVFPVVGRGRAVLQPVDVRDVAGAIVSAVERPDVLGRTFDVVGPDRLTLRDVVRLTAQGIGLPLAILPLPVALHRVAVRLMGRVTRRPLSTPAQLQMLVDGLSGDDAPARRDLGVVARPFTAEAVRPLAATVPPLFGWSLRLVAHRNHSAWLARRRAALPPALALGLAGIVLFPIVTAFVPNVWYRMAFTSALLTPFALHAADVGWRELFRPSRRLVLQGIGWTAVLYVLGWLVTQALLPVPGAREQIALLYAWKSSVAAPLVFPLLAFIVLGEEILWRNAVTLPLAARWGAVAGVVGASAGSAAMHVAMGVPLVMLAAFGAGAFWSAIVVRSRSAVPALVSHLVGDLAVMFWLPYA